FGERPAVFDDDDRLERAAIEAEAGVQRRAGLALRRGEAEAAPVVVPEDETGIGRAEHAMAVEDDDRPAFVHAQSVNMKVPVTLATGSPASPSWASPRTKPTLLVTPWQMPRPTIVLPGRAGRR